MLLLILALVAGWYYFYEIRGERYRAEQAVEAKRVFPGLDPSDITGFEFVRTASGDPQEEPFGTDSESGAMSFQFSKTDLIWRIAYPVHTDADTAKIDDLVDRIAHISCDRSITPVEDRSVYGLANPAFRLILTTKGPGKTELSFLLGNENPTGQFFYGSKDAGSDICLVSNAIKEDLTKDLFYFRDKRILHFDAADVRRMEINTEKLPHLTVERKQDEWILGGETPQPGDTGRISDLLYALRDQQISRVISETCENPDQYGLDRPRAQIRLFLSPSDASHVLHIGRSTDDSGKFFFAIRENNPHVFAVSRDLIEKLPADPFDFRSKDICSFERNSVQRLSIVNSNGKYDLVRDGESEWRMISPSQFEADSTVIGSILSDLAYLKATGIGDGSESFGEINLQVSLYEEGKADPFLEITAGGHPPDGVGRWLKTTGTVSVFRVSESDIRRFQKTEFDFRKKDLLVFRRDALEQIELARYDTRLIFSPDRDSWRVVEPEDPDIAESDLDDIFWAVNNLKMNGIVAENQPSLEVFGLDQPILSIKIKLKNQILGPLLIGAETPDGTNRYAAFRNSSQIVTISGDSLKNVIHLPFFNPDNQDDNPFDTGTNVN